MAIDPSVQSKPALLYQQLTSELSDIECKQMDDNRWFELQEDHLVLAERPLDCLALIWKFLVRLFTNELPRLEQKFTQITDLVDEYLGVENDAEQLSEFLGRYSVALNELYRSAAKMQRAQRISEQTLAHMKQKPAIEALILADKYVNFFKVGSSLKNAQVQFKFEQREANYANFLSTQKFAESHIACSFVIDLPKPNRIWAEIRHDFPLRMIGQTAYQLSIDSKGVLTSNRLPADASKGLLRFLNQSGKEMRVSIASQAREVAQLPAIEIEQFVMHDGASKEFIVPQEFRNVALNVTALFETARKDFRLCKLASHTFVIDKDAVFQWHTSPGYVCKEGKQNSLKLEKGEGLTLSAVKDASPEQLVVLDVEGAFEMRFVIDRSQASEAARYDDTLAHLSRHFAGQTERIAKIAREGIQVIARIDQVKWL